MKMEMKVQITSRRAVKPVNPTPSHLRRVQLSFIDQITNQNFVPFIFFYHHHPQSNNNYKNTPLQISHTLEQSLGQLLTKFYPLAGRLKDNQYIDCNDDGVHYFEARADRRLSQLLQNPNDFDLNLLLPYYELHDAGELLLAIQVTFFDCGGFAVATNFSHKIGDALSMFLFVKWWGETARGDTEGIVYPKFDLAKSFPPIDNTSIASHNIETGISEDKFVSKSFVFDDSSIAALKARHPARVSRVEALTSFLWSRPVAAAAAGEKQQAAADTIYVAVQAINLRPRINFHEMCFGNLSWFRTTSLVVNYNKKSVEEYGADLVMALREAIKDTDSDYAKRFQEGRIDAIQTKQNGDKPSNVEMGDPCAFSSLIRMPVYDVDFGWGKPAWVTMATQPFQNFMIFLPTPSGKGVQVKLNLKEDSMAKLEADEEFMAFTTSQIDC